MRTNAARTRIEAVEILGVGGAEGVRSAPAASVGLGALPKFAEGVGRRKVRHRAGGALVGVIRALVGAGELPDIDDGRPLTELARAGLTGWLQKSWGGLKHFDLRFVLCESLLEAVDDMQPEDQHAAERLREAIEQDFGVSIEEAAVGIQVETTGQRWLSVSGKVAELERQHRGLGWAALKAVCGVGVGYGMVDFSFLECAASTAYWCQGESEKDWAKEWGEPLSEFGGVTRKEFDEAFPLKEMRASRGPTISRLRAIAGAGGWAAEVARRVLELRKLGDAATPFETRACDDANDTSVSNDVGVVLSWRDTGLVIRVLDDYMGPYMESGENVKTGIGTIALRLDGGEHMMQLTRGWSAASRRLKAADALLDLIAECGDGVS